MAPEEEQAAATEPPYTCGEDGDAPVASVACPFAEAIGDDVFELIVGTRLLPINVRNELKGVSRAWQAVLRRQLSTSTCDLHGLLRFRAPEHMVLARLRTKPEEAKEERGEGNSPLPLHSAIKFGASETVVRELLAVYPAAAKYTCEDSIGSWRAIVQAARYGASAGVAAAVAEHTDLRRLSVFELVEARELGAPELLRRLRVNPDIALTSEYGNRSYPEGRLVLHYAVAPIACWQDSLDPYGRVERVKREPFANGDALTEVVTALIAARQEVVWWGCSGCTSRCGTSICPKDNDHCMHIWHGDIPDPPLHIACQHKAPPIVLLMLLRQSSQMAGCRNADNELPLFLLLEPTLCGVRATAEQVRTFLDVSPRAARMRFRPSTAHGIRRGAATSTYTEADDLGLLPYHYAQQHSAEAEVLAALLAAHPLAAFTVSDLIVADEAGEGELLERLAGDPALARVPTDCSNHPLTLAVMRKASLAVVTALVAADPAAVTALSTTYRVHPIEKGFLEDADFRKDAAAVAYRSGELQLVRGHEHLPDEVVAEAKEVARKGAGRFGFGSLRPNDPIPGQASPYWDASRLVGSRVRVQGLTKRPDLNGMCGFVLSFDGIEREEQVGRLDKTEVEKGRYAVQLDAAEKPLLMRWQKLVPLVPVRHPLIWRARSDDVLAALLAADMPISVDGEPREHAGSWPAARASSDTRYATAVQRVLADPADGGYGFGKHADVLLSGVES